MENQSLKAKLGRYMDAGFPIIYVNTFEEDKLDGILREVSAGRDIYEWNETQGYIDAETRAPMQEDVSLDTMLDTFKIKEMLDGKILVFKDLNAYLEDPVTVSKIKGLARMICQGIDANIVIVSNRLIIPKELEQFITILEMDYLDRDEIRKIIVDFIAENNVSGVREELIDETLFAEGCFLFASEYAPNDVENQIGRLV